MPSQTVAFQNGTTLTPELGAMFLEATEEISALFDGMTETADIGATSCFLIGRTLRENHR
jgi:hypothetical protein